MSNFEELTIREGGEAYIRYCSGINVMQDPEAWSEAHLVKDLSDMDESKAEPIICYSERLMLSGIKGFIQASLPEGEKSHSARFTNEVEIRMIRLMDDVFEQPPVIKQLTAINDRYELLRPAAFLRHNVFHDVTHGKYGRLYTADLMDEGYFPSTIISTWVQGRRAKNPRSRSGGRFGVITGGDEAVQ